MVTALQRVNEMEDRAAAAKNRVMFDSNAEDFF
jgi:hypothetical protein